MTISNNNWTSYLIVTYLYGRYFTIKENMKKSEVFDIIIDKVSDICEVDCNSIINCDKIQSVVDARILVVHYLRKLGFTNDDVALCVLRKLNGDNNYLPSTDIIRKKAKGVAKMFYAFPARWDGSKMFQHYTIMCCKFFNDFSKELTRNLTETN